MSKYQGHRSWNAWNVALWIGNDEGLYHLALDYWRSAKASGAKNPVRRAAIRSKQWGLQ